PGGAARRAAAALREPGGAAARIGLRRRAHRLRAARELNSRDEKRGLGDTLKPPEGAAPPAPLLGSSSTGARRPFSFLEVLTEQRASDAFSGARKRRQRGASAARERLARGGERRGDDGHGAAQRTQRAALLHRQSREGGPRRW